jgi:hypothetical protein
MINLNIFIKNCQGKRMGGKEKLITSKKKLKKKSLQRKKIVTHY